jgi:hypothetical protein
MLMSALPPKADIATTREMVDVSRRLHQPDAVRRPAANDCLHVWPVSRRVNSWKAADNDPALIARVAV